MTTVSHTVECSVRDCGRKATSLGFCPAHYQRTKRGAPLDAPILQHRPQNHSDTCLYCDRRVKAKDMCNSHWKQTVFYGVEARPVKAWDKQEGECSVQLCKQASEKKGYCLLHYNHSRQETGISLAPKRSSFKPGVCILQGCDLPKDQAKGTCKKHSALLRNYKLTSIQYEMMRAVGCMICGSVLELHVDHDHSCCTDRKRTCGSCLRGMLCRPCNHGVGMFRDDPARLASAIVYLSR